MVQEYERAWQNGTIVRKFGGPKTFFGGTGPVAPVALTDKKALNLTIIYQILRLQ